MFRRTTLNFTVPICDPLPRQYFIRIISDRWLGSQTVLPVPFKSLILPDKVPPPTKLLDLVPLPITALRNGPYEALYQEFKHFNRVQTHVFHFLYNTDDNVLVAAPTGYGKIICAEVALLRNHRRTPERLVAYIAPIEALAKKRYREWQKKFGNLLSVVELTGETSTDLKLLETGQVIISTPEKWDAPFRCSDVCKQVLQFGLLIIDELHLIGGQRGPVLEMVVTRIRYIASRAGKRIRIVALSTSLANAKDLGEWIGATSNCQFNFPLAVRPVPLDIHIQGLDIENYESRMQAMTKPMYTAVVQHVKSGKSALVFVPTRKRARLTAIDLMTYLNVDREEKPHLLRSAEELERLITKVENPILKATLLHGIGYLHEGLTSIEQELVSLLFTDGWIQVCVASSSMCWGLSLSAPLVVIMGTYTTQFYDGEENARADYAVSDLLQMMGHASRPLLDNSGKCVILCHAPCEEYYKKFLYEALPVESHLHHFLHDLFIAEINVGVIGHVQNALNYLAGTFMYRRLAQNPCYYNLQGVSDRDVWGHLSELIENTMSDLEASNCVWMNEDFNRLQSSVLGWIASCHYIKYTTIERFSSLLNPNRKMKGLLKILSSAAEYTQLPVRPDEEELIRRLINHQRFSYEDCELVNPDMKANALLQAHFSRHTVKGNLAADQREVLLLASRLVGAMLDVASSRRWLNLTLLTIEVSQMVTQGMWERDSLLLQLPHFTKDLAKRCHENPEKNIETVYDLMDMEDNERKDLLQMSFPELDKVAHFCRFCYPNINMTYYIKNRVKVVGSSPGNVVRLHVTLERDVGGRSDVTPVYALRYPKAKTEVWFLVVGDSKMDSLLTIEKVSLQLKSEVTLEFPDYYSKAGKKSYTLYLMCDSYMGCDQEYYFTIDLDRKTGQRTLRSDDGDSA